MARQRAAKQRNGKERQNVLELVWEKEPRRHQGNIAKAMPSSSNTENVMTGATIEGDGRKRKASSSGGLC